MSKTIVITGTSSGFGKLAVQTLAKEGHQVFATMRGVNGKNAENAQNIRNWAQENNANVEIVELDVTSDDSVNAAAKTVIDKAGKVDVVVNNAGVYASGIDESFSASDYQKMYDVNVFGVVRVTRAFLPQMRKQKSGAFVQVSSLLGQFTIPYSGMYCSSKWAVESICENLRYELAPLGIDSVIVQPGAFKTEIFGKYFQPSNPEIAEQYGSSLETMQGFTNGFGEMMAGEVPNQPQDVADAIRDIINIPAGQRPIRVTVDKMMPGTAEPRNEVLAEVQKGFMTHMQLDGLLQTQPQGAEV